MTEARATRLLRALAGAVALAGFGVAAPRSVSSADLLEAGPHAVGFRATWVLDPGRSYALRTEEGVLYGGEGRAPRPVLVQLWYPARAGGGEPMPYGAYLAPEPEDDALVSLARALEDHARAVVVGELFGTAEGELDAERAAHLARFLAAPTRCVRDASPADGPFPLVVYHSGAGSSFEDNAAFCEYLASHGYVVAGSAYPAASGSGLGVDAADGSLGDMEFLVRQAAQEPFVDWTRIAAGGHSLGGQTVLRWLVRPGCVVDAAFVLDTTMDYYLASVPMHDALEADLARGAEHLSAPLLVTAGPEATFGFIDSLTGVERTYLTVPLLDHNEFIAQGLATLAMLDATGAPDPRAPRVRAHYADLCAAVRAFLDAELRGLRGPWDARRAAGRETVLGADALHVEVAAAGEAEPAAYDAQSGLAPTPRQWAAAARTGDVEWLDAQLERFAEVEPRSPVYTSTMFMSSVLFDLDQRGRLEDARALHAAFRRYRERPLSALGFLASYFSGGSVERARRYLEAALRINPDDGAFARQLGDLDGK